MNNISININGVDCEVSWSEITTKLKQFVSWQAIPLKIDEIDNVEFLNDYKNGIRWIADTFLSCLPDNLDRTQVKKIISVGSGISTLELLLLQYFTNAHIWLVDKSEITNPTYFLPNGRVEFPVEVYKNHQVGFYNDWDITNDAISTSNLDISRIHFLDAADPWPNDVDIIYSGWAWCWDINKDEYNERAMNSLKIGGSLIVDVYEEIDRNIVQEISEQLGNQPNTSIKRDKSKVSTALNPEINWDKLNDLNITQAEYVEILNKVHTFLNYFNIKEDGIYGGRYSWTRV